MEDLDAGDLPHYIRIFSVVTFISKPKLGSNSVNKVHHLNVKGRFTSKVQCVPMAVISCLVEASCFWRSQVFLDLDQLTTSQQVSQSFKHPQGCKSCFIGHRQLWTRLTARSFKFSSHGMEECERAGRRNECTCKMTVSRRCSNFWQILG